MANTYSLDLELSSSQYAYITDANQTGLDITGDMTIEAWIMLEQLPSDAGTNMVICAKDDVGVSRAYSFLIQTADDKLLFATFGTSSTSTRFTMDEVFDADDLGVWIHVTAEIDVSASTITFHKNTVLKAGTFVANNATDIVNSTAPFTVGARLSSSSPTEYFDGKIDELRVWNDIRTGAEIADNWISDISAASAGLVAYYKYENNYSDETSNDNDLTAVNTPVFSSVVPFTTYTSALVESLGISDTLDRAVDISVSINDDIGITDLNAYFTTLLASLADSIGLADTLSPITSIYRTIVDPMSLSDVVAGVSILSVSIVDDIGVTDTLITYYIFRKTSIVSIESVVGGSVEVDGIGDYSIRLEVIDDK